MSRKAAPVAHPLVLARWNPSIDAIGVDAWLHPGVMDGLDGNRVMVDASAVPVVRHVVRVWLLLGRVPSITSVRG